MGDIVQLCTVSESVLSGLRQITYKQMKTTKQIVEKTR